MRIWIKCKIWGCSKFPGDLFYEETASQSVGLNGGSKTRRPTARTSHGVSRLYWKFLLQSNGRNLLMVLILYHRRQQKQDFLASPFTAFMIAWWNTSLRLSWVVAEQSIYLIRLNFLTSFSASLLVTWFFLEKGKSSHSSLSWSRNGPGVCGEKSCIFLKICLGSNKNDGGPRVMRSYLWDPFCLPEIRNIETRLRICYKETNCSPFHIPKILLYWPQHSLEWS